MTTPWACVDNNFKLTSSQHLEHELTSLVFVKNHLTFHLFCSRCLTWIQCNAVLSASDVLILLFSYCDDISGIENVLVL